MDMETRSGDRLLKELRNEVAHLGSELEDFDPRMELNPGFDLARLEEVMESLLELGYADELLAAGRKLHRKGLNLIEHFDEDGSLTMELQPCLDLVFKALPRSSLSRSEQILWAIDLELRDWFDLCEGIHNFLDLRLPKEAWSQAADALLKRLSKQEETSRSQSVFSKTDSERLVDWMTLALEKADRLNEISSLLEGEAKKTGRTTPLIKHLIRLGRQEEAKGWIARERQAARKQGSGLSSLDSELIQRFLEIMELEGNLAGIQTLKAETFFDRPTLEAYTELLASSDLTIKPNEAFSGKGHRNHICKSCSSRPQAERDAIIQQEEIIGFLQQSNISRKNISRLRDLAKSENARTAELAGLVLEVAEVKPSKKRRLNFLAQKRPELLDRLEQRRDLQGRLEERLMKACRMTVDETSTSGGGDADSGSLLLQNRKYGKARPGGCRRC
jgi:hypothetical protein